MKLTNNFIVIISILAMLLGCATTQTKQLPSAVEPTQVTPKEQTVNIVISEKLPSQIESAKKYGAEQIPPYHPLTDPPLISRNTSVIKDEIHSKITRHISMGDVEVFHDDMTILYKYTELRNVNLLFFSGGGDALAGIALNEEIEYWTIMGFRFTGYATGLVASAALPPFMACERRFAAHGTLFMVHKTTMHKWRSKETLDVLEEQTSFLLKHKRNYILSLRESTLKPDEWDKNINKSWWFTAQAAVEINVVHEITNPKDLVDKIKKERRSNN